MYGIYNGNDLIARFAAPTSVVSNRPVFSTDALSLKRSISKRSAQRWEITSNLEPLSHTANELFVLFTTKGHFSAVTVRVPQNYGVISKINAIAGSTLAEATCSAGANTISLSNSVPGGRTIPKGTFVTSASHSKVYITTDDITSGTSSVGIYPEAVADFSGALRFKEVEMPCYIESDTVIGMTFTDGILMDLGTVKLVEKL